MGPRESEPRRRRDVGAIPLDRTFLEKHFRGAADKLCTEFEVTAGLSPSSVGSAREAAVRDFLSRHLPGLLDVGTGHVLYEESPSAQQDILVYSRASLALPLGDLHLCFPEGVIATIEVKSTLTRAGLGDAGQSFATIRDPQPLKAVLAWRLENDHMYRDRIARWLQELGLDSRSTPDIVVILNLGAVARSGELHVLDSVEKHLAKTVRFYKYGKFGIEAWVGLAALVGEIAQRGAGLNLAQHWSSMFSAHAVPANASGPHA